MKSVLMIPYFFPPEGSAGVFRPLRFVRQLVSMGWETTVVTGHSYRYERYDPQLVAHIPKETEILRVMASDPWQAFQAWRGKHLPHNQSESKSETIDQVQVNQQTLFHTQIGRFRRMVESYYYTPDRYKPWIRPAVKVVREVCERKRPLALWATISPISAGMVARETSQLTGIPYVLDFRDPWELYYYEHESRRPRSVIRMAHRTMYGLLEAAQAVVFLFPRMAECYWQAYKGALNASKVHIIPNGYEGEIEEFHMPIGNICNILYTGTIGSYRFDTLLQALQTLKMTHPALVGKVRVLFVGDGTPRLAREASIRGISDIVETAPAVSYEEVKILNRKAHAFLILGRHSERKGHELVAGAKLFGYFQSRKPIIGVLPDDETKRILASVGVETVADVDSVPEIMGVLEKVYAAWSAGQLSSLLPNAQSCESYASQPQTLALIRALEGQPPAEPFVPGKVDVPPSLRETIEDKSLWFGKS